MATKVLSGTGLTKKLAAAKSEAAAQNKRVKIADGNNLMLIVRPNGGASWVLDYFKPGAKARSPHTLGAWPTVTLEKARELADAARLKTIEGIDPGQERIEAKAEVALEKTKASENVLALFEAWMANCKHSDIYAKNIRAAFRKDVLPEIGSMRPGDVTTKHINAILRTIDDRGAVGIRKKVRMWIGHMFAYGVDDERQSVETNPTPIALNRSFKTAKKGNFPAVTDPVEARKLMGKIIKVGSTVARTYLVLSAHLFQRPSEVRRATWDEFDLDAAKWTIPAARMKKKREHWVPLSPTVVEMLRKHQGVVGDDGFLFPGRSGTKPMTGENMEHAVWALGYKGIHCPHGFRAMAHSIMAERLKVDERFIEKQLSHEIGNQVKKAYNRAEFWDDRVIMMEEWSNWLLAATPKSAP